MTTRCGMHPLIPAPACAGAGSSGNPVLGVSHQVALGPRLRGDERRQDAPARYFAATISRGVTMVTMASALSPAKSGSRLSASKLRGAGIGSPSARIAAKRPARTYRRPKCSRARRESSPRSWCRRPCEPVRCSPPLPYRRSFNAACRYIDLTVFGCKSLRGCGTVTLPGLAACLK
jgi:hypothetical protein